MLREFARIRITLLFFVLSPLFFSVGLNAGVNFNGMGESVVNKETAPSNHEYETLRVVYLRDFPPLYVQDETGALSGFAVELVERLTQNLDIRIEPIIVESWEDAYVTLLVEKGDLIPGIAVLEERKEETIYSIDIVFEPVSFFYLSGGPAYRDISDFLNKRVGAIRGSAAESYLLANSEIEPFLVPNIETLLVLLLSGELKVVLCPEATMYSQAAEIGVSRRIEVFPEPALELNRAYQFRKEDVGLRDLFNEEIDRFWHTEDYWVLYRKWYEREPYWTPLRIAFMAAIIVALAAIFISTVIYAKYYITKIRLAERNSLFYTLFESMTESVLLCEMTAGKHLGTQQFMIVDTNKSLTELTGISQETAVGKPVDSIFPKEISSYQQDYEAVASGGKSFRHVLYWEKMHRHLEISVVSPQKGMIAIIANDVTGRKQREEEIQRLNENLEALVRIRTAQLEATNKELEAFSYSVSHDLRAPLRHVNGYVELLRKKFYDILPEKAKHYISNITDAAIQMGTLIDDLLQFSRAGKKELQYREINMAVLVKELLDKLIDKNEGNIKCSVSDLPTVNGDYSLIRQVWVNLLENAIKYTRKKEKAIIEVGYTREEKNHVFYVKDNGIGFDMKYAKNLFGVFQRLHSQADFEGTGIGLANVQRIIHKHSGKVWAEAEPEKGAIFYFTLPIKEVEVS